MKKIIYMFILFIGVSTMALGEMHGHHRDRDGDMMKRHYMKEIHYEDLTEEQKEQMMILRKELMLAERNINSRLREIRGGMNHCMRSEGDEDMETYNSLREERKHLLGMKKDIRERYKRRFREVIKKQ